MSLAATLARLYDMETLSRCELVERISGDLVRVESDGSTWWLKLANKTRRPREELEAEAEVVAGLEQRGLSVAAPVMRIDGCYAGSIALPDGPCAAVLYREAAGVEVAAATTAQAEALATLVAKLHQAREIPSATRRWRIDADALATIPLQRVRPWLQRAGFDVGDLEDIAAQMIARAWPPDGAALPVGICHGDLQLENIRFAGDAPTLFDFEVCGVGPCVYDLACYWRKRIGLAPIGDPPARAEWDALLRGYNRVRHLSDPELRAVPALAALRAIWVMALPASPDARWGRDWLVDRDYFTAHVEMIERLAGLAQ